MDCASCVINIDGVLEDTEGIEKARTSYVRELTDVTFNAKKVSPQSIISIIKQVGYEASIIDQKR